MRVKRGNQILFWGLALCLLLANPMQAQRNRDKDLKIDPIAQDLISQGKRFLRAGNYRLAWDAFESAIDRPFHQGTTAAVYLSGIAALQGQQENVALKRFEEIIQQYPLSRYVEEAVYHRALIYLKATSISLQQTGLLELLELESSARDPQLREDALTAVRAFTFEDIALNDLETMYDEAQLGQKDLFLVPLVYQLTEVGRKEDAESYYGDYLWMGGNDLPYLERILAEDVVTTAVAERSVIKLALVLPIHYERLSTYQIDSLKEIPGKTKLALEFYEGFEAALREHQDEGERKILLRVLDSERDSSVTEGILNNLDTFRPDMIIGDVYNQQSTQLSNWAEVMRVPQVIPLSPTYELVQGKNQTFLAHPAVQEHGVRMALFARDSLKLNKIAIWSDQRFATELLAQSFKNTFMSLGGEVVDFVVDSTFDREAVKGIEKLIREMGGTNVDGVYIPILSNEETCGLIFSLMDKMYSSRKLKVMGSPHWWLRYNNIDRELKDRYGVYFSSSYLVDPANEDYQNFYQYYLRRFEFPPSQYAVQGYDLGRYLLAILDQYEFRSGEALAEYLREYPVFNGIHTNFQFSGGQSNQFVNIGQFQESGIIKVNDAPSLELEDLFVPDEK
ncbi:MAG: ABC transporter substrate-binding protein [Bacteroidia bacterium]